MRMQKLIKTWNLFVANKNHQQVLSPCFFPMISLQILNKSASSLFSLAFNQLPTWQKVKFCCCCWLPLLPAPPLRESLTSRTIGGKLSLQQQRRNPGRTARSTDVSMIHDPPISMYLEIHTIFQTNSQEYLKLTWREIFRLLCKI